MKNEIEKIVSELKASIQVGELELYDIVQNVPSMMKIESKCFEIRISYTTGGDCVLQRNETQDI
jgi:hypothetical protein